MEDEKIIELYFSRNEQAVAETDKKYGAYCFTLASSILNNREDAEETVSDTYLKTWHAIPPKKPNVLKMFLAKITRNLAFSRWRSMTAEKRGGGELALVLEELSTCLAAPERVEDRLNARELAKTIRCFLNTLPQREQDIFLRRYFFVEDTDVIAQRYHIRPSAVLNILSRTRKRLKDYLRQEGYVV